MGVSNPQCRWVRDRLPLLAGDDLLGAERRRVERHLVGCPGCRGRHESLGQMLGVLQAAASQSPPLGDRASLWPALERQIRESRRPVPARSFPWTSAWVRLRPWPTVGLAAGLLVSLGLTFMVRRQAESSRSAIAQASRPIAAPDAPAEVPAEVPAPIHVVQQPAEPAADSVPPPRFDYDLDRGTPMGPDALDSKSKLTH